MWHWYLLLCIHEIFFSVFIASVHSFFNTFLKSVVDKLTEWSMIPACPSLLCFFNRGNTEGTNSSKILCLTFMYVLLDVNLCQYRFCCFQGIFGSMTCVKSKKETD